MLWKLRGLRWIFLILIMYAAWSNGRCLFLITERSKRASVSSFVVVAYLIRVVRLPPRLTWLKKHARQKFQIGQIRSNSRAGVAELKYGRMSGAIFDLGHTSAPCSKISSPNVRILLVFKSWSGGIKIWGGVFVFVCLGLFVCQFVDICAFPFKI